MANAIGIIIAVCLVIRFLASGGTMRRTTQARIDAVMRQRAAAQARQAARTAQRARTRASQSH